MGKARVAQACLLAPCASLWLALVVHRERAPGARSTNITLGETGVPEVRDVQPLPRFDQAHSSRTVWTLRLLRGCAQRSL
mmetsp:Transcript_39263/g.111271  ORF Transcript_39263/g.111271 Transcript_39263/m.111271 type:complete len:80 (-) Transcript_39263:1075-1314(-)